MAGQIRLRLTLGGEPLPMIGFDGVGVMLDGDIDVWPRDVRLELGLPRERDRQHFQRVLNGGSVKMTSSLEQDALVYTCDASGNLPAAQYQCRLSIAGLRTPPTIVLNVPTDGPEVVERTLDLVPDTRRVRLTAQPEFFESRVKALVMAPDSRIDGRPAADWIRDPNVLPRRKACVLNLLAKLRCVPSVEQPLIGSMQAIIGAQIERMYVRVSPALAAAASPLTREDDFRLEGSPRADIHQKLVTWVRTRLQHPEVPAVLFPLISYRQAVTRNSMQVVVASPDLATVPATDPPTRPGCYADLDIDLGGSLTDVAGFFIHMSELTSSDPTDHLKIFADLVKDPILNNFLYYEAMST